MSNQGNKLFLSDAHPCSHLTGKTFTRCCASAEARHLTMLLARSVPVQSQREQYRGARDPQHDIFCRMTFMK